jgi:2-dehydro-3-deoxygluconokinase
MTRFHVTSFGEAMIRLSVPAGTRLETAHQLEMHPAGSESNVLAALARLQRPCGWLSSLPNNPLGRLVTNQLRQAGVDISAVIWSEQGRMGTYFVEMSPSRPAPLRSSTTGPTPVSPNSGRRISPGITCWIPVCST